MSGRVRRIPVDSAAQHHRVVLHPAGYAVDRDAAVVEHVRAVHILHHDRRLRRPTGLSYGRNRQPNVMKLSFDLERRGLAMEGRNVLEIRDVQRSFQLMAHPPIAHLAGKHRLDICFETEMAQRGVDFPAAQMHLARDDRADAFTLPRLCIVNVYRDESDEGVSRPSIAMMPRRANRLW